MMNRGVTPRYDSHLKPFDEKAHHIDEVFDLIVGLGDTSVACLC